MRGVCPWRQAAGGVRKFCTQVKYQLVLQSWEYPRVTSKGGIPFPEKQDLGRNWAVTQWLGLWSQRRKQEPEAWSLEYKLEWGWPPSWVTLFYSVLGLQSVGVSPSGVWNGSRIRRGTTGCEEALLVGEAWEKTRQENSLSFPPIGWKENGANGFGNQSRGKGLEAFRWPPP